MRKAIICIAAAAALCLSACAGGAHGGALLSKDIKRGDPSVTFNYADGVTEPPTAYNSFSGAVSSFGFKLLRQSYKKNGSAAVMPANSVLQLSLLANGAKGDTKNEILFALGSDLSADSLNTCCSYFQSRMQSVGKQYLEQQGQKDVSPTLSMPRALILNDGYDVRKPFLQTNADYYASDIISLDFGGDKAAETLGELITGEKPSLDEADSMLSYSCLSFSDTWLSPYVSGSGTDGEMLHSEESFMQSEKAKGVIKYTAVNPLKALFIMPDGDFDDYVGKFDSAEYSKLLESVDVTKRQGVQLRPFSVGSGLSDISETLETAGLYTLFTEKSDFRSLVHETGLTLDGFYECAPSVYFSAAGISTESQEKSGAPGLDAAKDADEPKDDLVFDKPFIFMLTDNESNIPIYIATVK